VSLLGTDHADGHMQQCTTQPTHIFLSAALVSTQPVVCAVLAESPLGGQ